MKKINLNSVMSAFMLLVCTNKKTTTLEIKNLLRLIGYNATQKEVSYLLNQIYEYLFLLDGSKTIVRVDLGNYNEYTVSDDLIAMFEKETKTSYYADDYVSTTTTADPLVATLDDVNDSILQNIINDVIDSKIATPKNFENSRNIDKSLYSQNDWVVFDTNSEKLFAIYDEKNSRDQVRYNFSKTAGISKDDVRSKKVKNFK
jgi:hypothetical protein